MSNEKLAEWLHNWDGKYFHDTSYKAKGYYELQAEALHEAGYRLIPTDEKRASEIAKCLSPGLLPGQDMFEEEGYFFIKPERRLEIARLILTLINDKPSPASVKEIEDLIYKSPGWNLAKGSREEKKLARQILPLLTPELTLISDEEIERVRHETAREIFEEFERVIQAYGYMPTSSLEALMSKYQAGKD
jgi:hypothetical protein